MPDILQLAFKLSINATDILCMGIAIVGVYFFITLIGRLRK